jgi:TonB family protein
MQDDFGRGAYQLTTPDLVAPKVIQHPSPQYTSVALRARIDGEVEVEAVIGANGTVNDVRLLHSLDPTFGLDDSALATAGQWTFEPATLYGVPVAAIVHLVFEFRLH